MINGMIIYMGYTAYKRMSNNILIWEITKDGEFLTNMTYYDNELDNIKNFISLIKELTHG